MDRLLLGSFIGLGDVCVGHGARAGIEHRRVMLRIDNMRSEHLELFLLLKLLESWKIFVKVVSIFKSL